MEWSVVEIHLLLLHDLAHFEASCQLNLLKKSWSQFCLNISSINFYSSTQVAAKANRMSPFGVETVLNQTVLL